MKNLVFVSVIVCALCTAVVASDIAFYVGNPNVDGWYDVAGQTADVATIISRTGHLFSDIQQFDDGQFDAFGAWVDENTDDGELDIIWLNGCMPSVLYPFVNLEPDGSRIELWLDGGNMIINVGDWFGYVSYEGGAREAANTGTGAANILDLNAGIIQGSAAGTMDITADGAEYLPSLNAVAAERPVVLAEVQAPWEVAAAFGQNAAGTHADPVVIHNTETGGYLATINQATTWINDRGLTCAEFIANWVNTVVGLTNPALAGNPAPDDGVNDVLRDSVLTWSPGMYAGTHDLYFGESFDDVNNATVATAPGLDVNSFDPGRLEFEKMYYWRVDEVNATPDKTVYKGQVWSFTAEPYAIPIPGSEIGVTASSSANDFSTPDKAIDGSGLGADSTHSISSEDMWFTAAVDLDPWIQFEFEGVKQLETMRVWNSNSSAEVAIGWGVKDVEIATSVDGENWAVFEGATQFSRAPGLPTYDTYDTVTFDGVAAKYVRLNIASNWGGILMSYSLSEVQFDMIPAQARTPDPADGQADVLPNVVATWRAGREAAQHTIYVSTDQNEVADGLAPSVTSNANSVDMGQFDLEMGATYYWRVDEVNDAETPSVWAGPVWSFSTVEAIAVDDFESYNNISPDRPFQSWLDGFGYSADEHFPNGYAGNGTGAGIGHDIWSLTSPHYDGDIMETSNVMPGSGQSMPLYYTNTGGTASETQHTFAPAQDWTVGGAQTLSIAFYGTSGNTGTLYVKINGVKLTYPHDAGNIAIAAWQAWNIDLSTVSTNLASITEMAIGVDGGSATGMILIDDLRLHAEAGELITPEDPGTDGLVALYSFEGNANDASGNGNNGTVEGGALFVTGQVGSALDCDGTDDFVSTGKTASQLGLDGNNARTISSWVFTRGFNNGGIYDVGARSTLQDFSLRTMATDNVWRIQYWGNDSDFTLDSLDKWVHFTHVHDGVNTKIYANGMLIVDWEITLDTQDTNPFQIGRYGWPDAYFNGLIDEVHVYNRALSAEEALYLAGVSSPIDKPF